MAIWLPLKKSCKTLIRLMYGHCCVIFAATWVSMQIHSAPSVALAIANARPGNELQPTASPSLAADINNSTRTTAADRLPHLDVLYADH